MIQVNMEQNLSDDTTSTTNFSDSVHPAFKDLREPYNTQSIEPLPSDDVSLGHPSSISTPSTTLSAVEMEIVPTKEADRINIDIFFKEDAEKEDEPKAPKSSEPIALKPKSKRIGKEGPTKPAKKATESIKRIMRTFRKEYIKGIDYEAKHVEEYFT